MRSMSQNKTQPTVVKVEKFLATVSERRRTEARALIALMREITDKQPVMWGPSIIGFGSRHYKYETGREGETPELGFSPRKAAITIYFGEGFDRYGEQLAKLGKYKSSVSCLYINKLADIDLAVLRQMLKLSYQGRVAPLDKPTTVDEYLQRIPPAARPQFDELRTLVTKELPDAKEVLSYGIVGYTRDGRRPRVFISGWKDHTAMYPLPKDKALLNELKPYIKGKGTLWFPLDQPLPTVLIKKVVRALISPTIVVPKNTR